MLVSCQTARPKDGLVKRAHSCRAPTVGLPDIALLEEFAGELSGGARRCVCALAHSRGSIACRFAAGLSICTNHCACQIEAARVRVLTPSLRAAECTCNRGSARPVIENTYRESPRRGPRSPLISKLPDTACLTPDLGAGSFPGRCFEQFADLLQKACPACVYCLGVHVSLLRLREKVARATGGGRYGDEQTAGAARSPTRVSRKRPLADSCPGNYRPR